MTLPIAIDHHQLTTFCEKHRIVKLGLFGLALRDDFGPNSDVDVPVEFDAGHISTRLGIAGMEEEFSALLGRKADMRTPRDLSDSFREEIVNTALVRDAA
ncbi:MAG: hypothetical protein AMXMBFR4_24910 [Candidatus Hydrogenedentota bacterium]